MITILTKPFLEYSASWSIDIFRLTDMLNKADDLNPWLFGTARDVFWLMADVASFA